MRLLPLPMQSTKTLPDKVKPGRAGSPGGPGGLALIILLVALVVGGGIFAYRQFNQPSTQVKQAQTVPAMREDVQITVSASGLVQPLQSVNISPKTPGRVSEILVGEGTKVSTGQVLARMDSSNLQGQLTQAEGQLAGAEANLQKVLAGSRPEEIEQAEATVREAEAALASAQRVYEQDRGLFDDDVIPQRVLINSTAQRDRAQAQLDSARQVLTLRRQGSRVQDVDAARAQVTVARGQVQTVRAQSTDTVLRAPFSGTITRVPADPGSFVSPTSPALSANSGVLTSVMTLAREPIVLANVAEADIARISLGQSVKVRADAYPGKTFSGRVREVAPESSVVQNVTSFQVKVTLLDNQAGLLRTGMNAEMDFVTGVVKGALLIPTVAIVRQENRTGVYVKTTKDKPEFRPIQTGINTGPRTQILAGLQPEEQVYISFPPGFRPDTATSTIPGGSLRGTVR